MASSQVRVLLTAALHEYELRAWTDSVPPPEAGWERVHVHDRHEALALLTAALAGESTRMLTSVLMDLETSASLDERTRLVHAADLIVRGLLVVERRPRSIMASEAVVIFERTVLEPLELEEVVDNDLWVYLEVTERPVPRVICEVEHQPPPRIWCGARTIREA